jgi:O-antigen ligase
VLAAVTHVADRMSDGRSLTGMEPEVRLVLLLLGLALLSIPTSYWSTGSVQILIDLLGKSVAVFLLLANILVTPARFHRMLWLITLCSAAPALGVIDNYLDGRYMQTEARVQGYGGALTSNANDVALTLNIVVPIALGLALAARRPAARVLLAGLVALAVAGIVVTISRAGFLFLACTVSLSVARLRRGRLAVVLLLLAVAVPLIVGTAGFTDRMLTITDVRGEASARDRWEGMGKAVEAIAAHPLFGAGIGQGVLALNELGGPRWREVHNMYLQIALDLGLPALIVLVALVCRSIRSVHHAARVWRARGDSMHHLAQGLETSLIGFAAAAMFYPIAYHFFFYYLLGLAVAARLLARRAAATPVRRARPRVTVPALPPLPAAVPLGAQGARR